MLLTGPQQSQLATLLHTDPNNIGFAPHVSSGDEAGLLVLVHQIVPNQTIQYSYLPKNSVLAAAISIRDLLDLYALSPTTVGVDGKTVLTQANVALANAALDYIDNLDPGSNLQFATWNALGVNFVTMNMMTVAQATAFGTGSCNSIQLLLTSQTADCDITDITAALGILQTQGVQV
jgi:hypothetical protein